MIIKDFLKKLADNHKRKMDAMMQNVKNNKKLKTAIVQWRSGKNDDIRQEAYIQIYSIFKNLNYTHLEVEDFLTYYCKSSKMPDNGEKPNYEQGN